MIKRKKLETPEQRIERLENVVRVLIGWTKMVARETDCPYHLTLDLDDTRIPTLE